MPDSPSLRSPDTTFSSTTPLEQSIFYPSKWLVVPRDATATARTRCVECAMFGFFFVDLWVFFCLLGWEKRDESKVWVNEGSDQQGSPR